MGRERVGQEEREEIESKVDGARTRPSSPLFIWLPISGHNIPRRFK